MKKIKDFAAKNGLVVADIRYKFKGHTLPRKGFDLCLPDGSVVLEFEPNYLSNKWIVRGHSRANYGMPLSLHVPRITKDIFSRFVIEPIGCKRSDINKYLLISK